MGITFVLQFIRSNWKFFAGMIAIVALYFTYTNHIENVRNAGMQEGIEKQAAKDKEEWDKVQARHDEKVKWLENHTTDLANSMAMTNSVNSARIAELNKLVSAKIKELDRTTYDASGKPVTCPTPGADTYLGNEFTESWNKYNKGDTK
jgi:hypothetical protein